MGGVSCVMDACGWDECGCEGVRGGARYTKLMHSNISKFT